LSFLENFKLGYPLVRKPESEDVVGIQGKEAANKNHAAKRNNAEVGDVSSKFLF
jgi:hypothetical protein